MKYRIFLGAFLSLLLVSACSSSKDLAISEPQSVEPIAKIENYTPRALIEDSNCYQPLTNTTFLKIMDKLKVETIELARLEMAEKVLEVHCYTSNQIVRMMSLFNFEKNKLSLAKKAFTHCYDQDNYFIVLRELKLEQSKTELENYTESVN